MKYIITLNNKRYEIEVERGQAEILSTSEAALKDLQSVNTIKPATECAVQACSNGEKLKAPMPGTILDVKVNQGDKVKKGDILFILEAMKMENEITATKDGIVAQIFVAKDTSVATSDVLAVIQ